MGIQIDRILSGRCEVSLSVGTIGQALCDLHKWRWKGGIVSPAPDFERLDEVTIFGTFTRASYFCSGLKSCTAIG